MKNFEKAEAFFKYLENLMESYQLIGIIRRDKGSAYYTLDIIPPDALSGQNPYYTGFLFMPFARGTKVVESRGKTPAEALKAIFVNLKDFYPFVSIPKELPIQFIQELIEETGISSVHLSFSSFPKPFVTLSNHSQFFCGCGETLTTALQNVLSELKIS